MFAPPLYVVRKLSLSYIIAHNYNIQISPEEEKQFYVKQQDNMLFRQIRMITYESDKYNRFVIFVNCAGGQNKKKQMRKLIHNGFKFGNQDFVLSERSASMVRQGILSFVDKRLSNELDKRITMGIDIDKTVLSKYYAYRGLMYSSCHCIEDWIPNIVVVPDCFLTIKDQNIKYVYDKHLKFVDKNTGEERDWVQKDLAETTKDIEINAFDGCGIAHPKIMDEIRRRIGSDTPVTSAIIRLPFIKGVVHSMDYETFFEERGVNFITDVWGVQHNVSPGAEPIMILTLGQYKGFQYFNKTNTIADWEEYWFQFKKFKHCMGIAKWNFDSDLEPLYTRANYQILQDLDLPYEKFRSLADTSIEWFEKITSGDPVYTFCFLGMFADKHKALNDYCAAILKNPAMMQEDGCRQYITNLLTKYRDDMKCGKIWLKATFKFMAPDLIMLMEHIGGLPLKGCLESDEFYSFDRTGVMLGERLIERNPHICKSEHVILKAVNNDLLEKYCSHLTNVALINCKSIVPQRLNGADMDGDLCFVIDDKVMMQGVDRNAKIVLDVEDKITSLKEADTIQNKTACILRSLRNQIGEISNYASAYHNKIPKTKEQKDRYESYIGLLSVINGKCIDFAKTGVMYPVPRMIAKYGRPLPYFMKYASPYYKRMKKLSGALSNMNQLCFDIERWEGNFRKRRTTEFDWSIMIDPEVGYTEEHFKEIEKIYIEFSKTCKELSEFERQCKNYDRYREILSAEGISKELASEFETDWQYYYNVYRNRCQNIVENPKELANIAVELCYGKYKNRNKKFMWMMAGKGIVQNIKQVNIRLPQQCDDGEYEYLGKTYTLAPVTFSIDEKFDIVSSDDFMSMEGLDVL